jgi:hypothetical protein
MGPLSLGMLMGVAGLVTMVPPLEQAGSLFGLGLIVWFAVVGIAPMRGRGDVVQDTPGRKRGRTETPLSISDATRFATRPPSRRRYLTSTCSNSMTSSAACNASWPG